ncbi:MAG: hypothetical protein BWY36_00526 [Candidatus Diapherotrites archaeon ADurb.Bin253]|nr:MAG: hypothetical protein BWY36_00526 [Candidatus Diapherotrites archaeon ADurb.Bin253]
MAKSEVNYLSIIAIVLSIVAIVLVLVFNTSNKQIHDNLDTRIKQVFDMSVQDEKDARSNLFRVTSDLQIFNKCINDATKEFILCDSDGLNRSDCDYIYTEKRSRCESTLRESPFFE